MHKSDLKLNFDQGLCSKVKKWSYRNLAKASEVIYYAYCIVTHACLMNVAALEKTLFAWKTQYINVLVP